MTGPIRYDYKEFTLSNGEADYDVKANIVELFLNVPVASRVIIKTNKNISFRFNNTLLPLVDLDIGDSPYQSPENFLEVNNIYLTNSSGSDATVAIWLV